MPEVRLERSGWRDEGLSALHRTWGWDCPMIDVDWLVVEYDKAVPVALVEYKNEHAKPVDPTHPSYRALALMGDRARIPSVVVHYKSDYSLFRPVALNSIAQSKIPTDNVLSQREYIRWIYRLRGRVLKEASH